MDLFHCHRLSGFLRCRIRPLGGTGRAAQVHVHRRAVLRRRLPGLRGGNSSAPTVDHLPGLRRLGGLRSRHRLYFSGLHPDQVVSGSSGYGDGHGHHGLRRRRAHRRAPLGAADGAFQDGDFQRRARDLRHHGRHLLHVHDDRRLCSPRTGGRLETCRLDRTGAAQTTRDDGQCGGRCGVAHAAILAAVGGVVHERLRRHRRNRTSLAHDPGNLHRPGDAGGRGKLRRIAEPVQHAGPDSSGPRPPITSVGAIPT